MFTLNTQIPTLAVAPFVPSLRRIPNGMLSSLKGPNNRKRQKS